MLNTKAKAKRAAINMWTWLRDHPDKEKRDYKKASNWYCKCALCDYLVYRTNKGCIYCPLFRCLNDDAPYELWRKHINRAENAQRIIDLIKEW